MKKTIALLLTLVLCLSLCACGGKSPDIHAPTNSQEATAPTEPLMREYEGYWTINPRRFNECFKEIVELSMDNWRDYINVVSYTEEVVEYDAFGEIIETNYIDRRAFGVLNGNYFYYYEDVAIELENENSGEKIIFEIDNGNNTISEDFSIEDYTCTRIKGKVFVVDIPAEAILKPVPTFEYSCGFMVAGLPYEINEHTKVIYHNGLGTWEEAYIENYRK